MAIVVSDKRGCKKALTLLLVVGKIGPWSTSTQALVTFHPMLSYLISLIREMKSTRERTVLALEFYSKHFLSSYGLSKW